jgi:hypothetical protein
MQKRVERAFTESEDGAAGGRRQNVRSRPRASTSEGARRALPRRVRVARRDTHADILAGESCSEGDCDRGD